MPTRLQIICDAKFCNRISKALRRGGRLSYEKLTMRTINLICLTINIFLLLYTHYEPKNTVKIF